MRSELYISLFSVTNRELETFQSHPRIIRCTKTFRNGATAKQYDSVEQQKANIG